ncbi:ras di-ras and rheb family members of small gtpase superfamily [Anaeramoeba flamelloides]|uniref:Ras di-ras and rheb family members of small gtpase superfamily n=1 Tax=Anaeramoeba flamelloides TaxID=1746091 RepID=A0AAV7Z8G9_9EUKA|nr:ras di-ras and rheb family members of small gtpase superfamily [Anaeramoeba flamelloides]
MERFAILGARGVGKRTFIHSYLQGEFVEELLDREESINCNKEYLNCLAKVYDTDTFDYLNSEELYTIRNFIVMYSVTSRTSFYQVSTIIRALQSIKSNQVMNVMVIGNKTDLNEKREVEVDEMKIGNHVNKNLILNFEETSCQNLEQIGEAIHKFCTNQAKERQLKRKKDCAEYSTQVFFWSLCCCGCFDCGNFPKRDVYVRRRQCTIL